MADSNKSKADLIEERKANLPLPDDPPVASDFNSADGSRTNVGSGGISSDVSAGGGGASEGLRGPATGGSAVREDGSAFKENVAGMNVGRVPGGVPNDAVTADKRDAAGTTETRGADYGYPAKSDPSSGA